MRELSIEASAATTGSLIYVGRLVRQWKMALGFIGLEKRLHLDEDQLVSRISFNSAVSACEAASQWAEALDVVESMEGAVDGVTISACVQALLENGL